MNITEENRSNAWCEHCFQFSFFVFFGVNGIVNDRISFNCFSSVEVVQGVHTERKEFVT
jgi:hypothetical protein